MQSRLLLYLMAVLGMLGGLTWTAHAQNPSTDSKPFIMPVGGLPGPSTWMMGQPYGNTTGAFVSGANSYSAGQFLHFGIDISMPCGTPVLAVADGVVHSVDNSSRGSAPHNLLINFPQLSLTVLYGHLLQRSLLVAGQEVKQGDVVGLSGTPDSDCESRPHLHLEVRSLDHLHTYNPILFIDAPWHSLVGMNVQARSPFQMDLQNARRWMDLADQPDVRFGGARLNNYALTLPAEWQRRVPVHTLPARELGTVAEEWKLRQVGMGGCCFGAWWQANDSQSLYVIDGALGQAANVYQLPLAGGDPVLVQPAPAPFFSADGSHEILYQPDKTIVRRLSDATEWQILIQGYYPMLSPDNQQFAWVDTNDQLWLGTLEGESPTVIWQNQQPASDSLSVRWLDAQRLIISQRDDNRLTTLSVLNTADNSLYTLGTWYNLRTVTIAPGGEQLIFFSLFNPIADYDGAFLLDIVPNAVPQKLPWFGDYRWRDSHGLFYITFDPLTDIQQLHFYDLITGQSMPLTDPVTQPFTIANGDWSVAPNGEMIAFQAAQDGNLWLLEALPDVNMGG